MRKQKQSNNFTPSLILSCLDPKAPRGMSPELALIVARGADFLLSQKSASWTWNYWPRDSVQARTAPCPDDLDDTFMALTALSMHRPGALTGDALAHAVQTLAATEDKVGGPYHTWVIDRKADDRWDDIDIVVNSNVATFLKSQGVILPNLVTFAEDAIRDGIKAINRKSPNKAVLNGSVTGKPPADPQGLFSSQYYSPLAISYFISRWYEGPAAPDLARIVIGIRKKNGTWGDALSNAVAISALVNLKTHAKEYARALRSIAPLKSWDSIPFYIEAIKDGVPIRYGSSALTEALCIEALRKAEEASSSKPKTEKIPAHEREHRMIIAKAKKRLSFLPAETRVRTNALIDKMTDGDLGRQITLLSHHFLDGTRGAKGKEASERRLATELGTTNLLGWLAYKIYDDILDDEGDPGLLPVANACLRFVTETYRDILPATHQKTFHDIMNRLERANAWERENCRVANGAAHASLPDYGDHSVLADKSLAHALGPLALIIKRGGPSAESDLKHTLAFFKHYIIARQLNDDAHDWQEDLDRGFVNSVSARILKIAPPETRDAKKADETALARIFWNEVSDGVLADIENHIHKARKSLAKISLLKDISYFEKILIPLDNAVSKTRIEKKRMSEFLSAY